MMNCKLEEALEALEKPRLAQEKKDSLKENIFSRFAAEDSLIGDLRNLRERVFFGKKAYLKALLMRKIFGDDCPESTDVGFSFGNRRFGFAMVLAIFLFSSLFFFPFESGMVRAEVFTRLDYFQGEVKVLRNGAEVKLEQKMELLENDVVETGKNGAATIIYLDESVSRLSGDTEVVLKTLDDGGGNLKSHVEVELEEGVVWNKVLNLVEDHSTFVFQANNVQASAKKAAFNIQVKDDFLEIQVFNDFVEVQKDQLSKEINSGQKVIIDDSRIELLQLQEKEKNISWVKENLNNDQKYLDEVQEKSILAQKEAETPDDSSQGEAMLFLTFDDLKRQKIELDLVEAQLRSAELEGSGEVPEQKFEEFRKKVQQFDQMIEKIEKKDPKYAGELRSYLEEKILAHKEDLVLDPDQEDLPDISLEEKGPDNTNVRRIDIKIEEAPVEESTKLYDSVEVVGDKPLPPGL